MHIAILITIKENDLHWFNCWKSAAFFENAAAIWYGGGTSGTSFTFGTWTWSVFLLLIMIGILL